ncbi:MAG: DUF3078 domain-containing protein [Salinivirgaceae bacterium]
MKTKVTVVLMLIALSFPAISQVTEQEATLRKQKTDTVEGWKKGAVIGINLTQTSLTNWSAGGQNSVAVGGVVSLFANYAKNQSVWDNSLDIGYGLMRQGKGTDFMKTDDKIDLLSKYGQKAGKGWYYSALLNFKTQMTDGKDYNSADTATISRFLAPAYLLGAVGMDYKPNAYFSAFIAPLTGKLTIVNDQTLADAGAFGVDPAVYDGSNLLIEHGAKSKREFGAYLRAIYSKNDFKQELLKDVSFTTKVDLFTNYLKDPERIDVSWETQIALKVNKYITVNINTHLLYDYDIKIEKDENNNGSIEADEIRDRVQFKEILAVGFSYKF